MGERRALALVALLLATPATAQKLPVDDEPAPAPEAALARAQALFAEERYQQALEILQTAYADRQSPPLLFEIARCLERLGRAKEAVESYRRYLVALPNAPHELEAKAAMRALALFALPPAPASTTMPPFTVKRIRRPHRAMLATGWSLLSASYFAAFVTGALIAGTCSGSCNTDNLAAGAGTLIVPIVGPFISSGIVAQAAWSVPWSVVDGFMQVTGLALVIAAYTHPETVQKMQFSSLRLTTNGRGLALSGSF
jgi:hypothetical protein